MNYLFYIAAGGAAGAVLRYIVSGAVQNILGSTFPWGTMTVNLAGSFTIGLLAEFFENLIIPPAYRAFMLIGFLGAFTTFSTFSLETFRLLQDNEFKQAFLNILLSNISGIVLVILGIVSARFILNLCK